MIVQRAARMLPVDSIYREFFVWGIKKKCIFAFESGVWVKGVWRCIVLKTKRKRNEDLTITNIK